MHAWSGRKIVTFSSRAISCINVRKLGVASTLMEKVMSFIRTGAAAIASLIAFFALPTAVTAASFDSVAIATDRALASFDTVYIAPVKADLNLDVRKFDRSGQGDRPINDRDIADQAEDLQEELERAFSTAFSLAEAPGPGILTIEATLTDLASTRPTMADYARPGYIDQRSIYAGGAEATFVFSEDGQTLTTIGDRQFGSFGDHRPRIGVWDDANWTFGSWSRRLVKFVKNN